MAAFIPTVRRAEYDAFLTILRELREDANLSQGALAAKIGRTQTYVSKVERGAQRMDVLELVDYCRGLGISASIPIVRLESALMERGRKERSTPK